MQRSHLFAQLASDKALACNYTVSGHDYTMRHYLADGIYSSCSTFVKTTSDPKPEVQEACRKDVERVFGVLQARLFEVPLASGIKKMS